MPDLLCTTFDVIDKVPQLYDPGDDDGTTDGYSVYTLEEIQNFILEGDGIVRSKLRLLYGTDLTTNVTPWAKVPQSKLLGRFADASSKNSGTIKLLPFITVGSLAVTELWTITFSSATAFSVSGDLSGSQGSGTKSTAFTSTNTYITIPTANWSGTAASGDIIYIRTYEVEAALVQISSYMAAATILDSKYTEWVPNRSSMADAYREKAEDWMDRLIDPRSNEALEVGRASLDLSPIEQQGLRIDQFGDDVTEYETDEFDYESGSTYSEVE